MVPAKKIQPTQPVGSSAYVRAGCSLSARWVMAILLVDGSSILGPPRIGLIPSG